MNVHVQSVGFDLTESLATFAREKAYINLGRFGEIIRKVEIKLVDTNGPKGGEAMRCRIIIRQDNQPDIVVQETRDDLYGAISLGLQRAKQTVSRRKALVYPKNRRLLNSMKQTASTIE